MNPLAVITAGWYNLFYVLAVLVAAVMLYRAGRTAGRKSTSWRLIVFAWVAAGAIGATLPHYFLGDAVAPRTAIGAVVFATMALGIGAWAAGLRVATAMDAAWLAIPAGAAVVRIGCFLGGCCGGIETELPLAVDHRHPTQLYESAASLVLLGILRVLDRRLIHPGSRFLASIAGLSVIRFSLEFIRDSEKLGLLSLAQWITLPLAVACVAAVVVREAGEQEADLRRPTLKKEARYVIATAAVIAFAVSMPRLAPLEAALVLLAAFGLAAVQLRRSPTALGMSALWLQASPTIGDSVYPHTLKYVGGEASAGSYEVEHIVSNCDSGTTEHTKRSHGYHAVGLEAGVKRQMSRNSSVSARASAFAGSDNADPAVVLVGFDPHPAGFSTAISGFTLTGQADWRFLGIGGGVMGGHLLEPTDIQDETPGDRVGALPVVSIRIGTLRTFAMQLDIDNLGPIPNPGPALMLSARVALEGDNYFRAGVTDFGPAFIGSFRVGKDKNYELMPMLATTGERRAIAVGFRRWFAPPGSAPPPGR